MSEAHGSGKLRVRALPLVIAPMLGALGCSSNDDRSQSGEGDWDEQPSSLTITRGVEADSYVRSGAPNRNYGTATTLYSDRNDNGSVLQSYLRFSIGDVGTIARARLRLYVTAATSGPHDVRRVSSNAWGETSLSWNNKPAADGPLVATIGVVRSSTWIEIDITSWARANSTFSLAIVANTNDGIAFRSRQGGNNQPQVVIEATGPGVDGGDPGDSGVPVDAKDPGDAGSTVDAADAEDVGSTVDAVDPVDSDSAVDALDADGSGSVSDAPDSIDGDAADAGTATDSGSSDGDASKVATDPDLKIAFVADTDDGPIWASVLNLIVREGAQAIVVSGDMTYDDDPPGWWSTTESVLGPTYPVFLARGNHDDATWSGFLSKAGEHLGDATRIAGPHDAAYQTIFRGLSIATIKKGDAVSTLQGFLNGDAHTWKVCNWHQNQNKMQVGGKTDEMGWGVYEACRQQGAIIITAHEHSYHRTVTMTNTQTQSIDSNCSSGSNLCVGAGRTFVSVIGTGGVPLRSQVRCLPAAPSPPYPSMNTTDPSCPIWASIYTTNQSADYGAQFMTFHVDGDPKKARGYFKTLSGAIVDTFDIVAD